MKTILAASIAVLITASAANAAPFTPGDIVIYQVGSGTGSLTSAATPVFLDEYSVTGTLVQQIAMPTTASGANFALTDSGSASGDGMITLSGNGTSVIITGYDAAVGTSSIASSPSTQTIGIVSFNGTVDTSTTTNAFSGNNIRSATSVDGSGVWAVGGLGGVVYLPDGGSGAGTVVSSTATNNRVVEVFDGQLYVSSQKTPTGVSTVGTGTPTTSGQTMTLLPGQSTGSANESFAFADLNGSSTPNTLYVADTTAGIEKFSLEGSSWIETGSISGSNIEGITVSVVNSSTVDIFATSSGTLGTSGTLYGAVDSSGFEGTLSGSLNTLATAPANEAFRGVALAPEQLAVPEPSSALSIFFGAGVLGFLGRFRRRHRAASL
jgi:hypothetical protein